MNLFIGLGDWIFTNRGKKHLRNYDRMEYYRKKWKKSHYGSGNRPRYRRLHTKYKIKVSRFLKRR